MSRYKNTLTAGRDKTAIIGPPSAAKAAAWDALRALRPELDGARIVDFGQGLNVQVERTMGTAAWRTVIIAATAEAFRSRVETYETSWNGHPGVVTYTVITFQGEQFCVETTDCSCHPDGDQS